MSDQNTPRNINLSGARGGAQAGSGADNRAAAQAPGAQRRTVYDQAADAQRPQGAVQGQVRRTAPARPESQHVAAAQQARRQQMSAQQAQQRQAMAAQQRQGATYEEYTLTRSARGQTNNGVAPQGVPQRQTMPQRPATAAQRPTGMQQRSINLPLRAPNGQQQAAGTQRTFGASQGVDPRGADFAQPSRAASGAGDALPQGRQTYRSGAQGAGGNGGARRSQSGRAGGDTPENATAARKRKRLKSINRALTAMCASFAVFLVCYVGLRVYAGTIINTGEGGVTSKAYRTPPQYANNQLNVLLLGVDYTSEDGQGRSPSGMTDMVMYVRFDFTDNTIRMLQIPRDLFVGPEESTGGTGKMNSLYANGDDKNNRVNNIAKVLSEQYQLPVDNYVSIDMDSLREIIDLFGGITVYVSDEMEFAGSYIPSGWQHLDGASSEFFLRNRKQYATSDMRRLENQRYFYSALFRLVRTSPWQEIVKLVPVVRAYISTDIDPVDCAALGIKMLKIPSSQILMARLPVAGAAENYNGQSIIVCSVPETTELLNLYFRSAEQQVSAEQLNIAQLPTAGGIHPSNVQWMSDIDAEGGGTVGEAADATQTGDDVLQEAEAASQSQAAAQTSSAPAA